MFINKVFKFIFSVLKLIAERRKLITYFAFNHLRDQYRNSILGASWIFLPGIIKVVIYSIVFSTILKGRIAGAEDSPFGFAVYLVSGILMWESFSTALSDATSSFAQMRSYLLSGVISMGLIPLVKVVESQINVMISFFIMLVVLGGMNGLEPVAVMSLIPIIILQQIFAVALGTAMGVIQVFFSDFYHMVIIGIQVGFWATPIVYPVNILPEFFQKLVMLNPMTHFIDTYHKVFVTKVSVSFSDYILISSIVIITILLALFVYKKLRIELESAL